MPQRRIKLVFGQRQSWRRERQRLAGGWEQYSAGRMPALPGELAAAVAMILQLKAG
jgi:hypothetical protein